MTGETTGNKKVLLWNNLLTCSVSAAGMSRGVEMLKTMKVLFSFEVHFSMYLMGQMVHTWILAELKVIPIEYNSSLFSEADLALFIGKFHLCHIKAKPLTANLSAIPVGCYAQWVAVWLLCAPAFHLKQVVTQDVWSGKDSCLCCRNVYLDSETNKSYLFKEMSVVPTFLFPPRRWGGLPLGELRVTTVFSVGARF